MRLQAPSESVLFYSGKIIFKANYLQSNSFPNFSSLKAASLGKATQSVSMMEIQDSDVVSCDCQPSPYSKLEIAAIADPSTANARSLDHKIGFLGPACITPLHGSVAYQEIFLKSISMVMYLYSWISYDWKPRRRATFISLSFLPQADSWNHLQNKNLLKLLFCLQFMCLII